MRRRFSLNEIMSRTGGWYIIIVIAVAQFISILGAIPGILSIQVNAEFNEQQLTIFSWAVPLLIVFSSLILLAISWRLSPAARKRLNDWAGGSFHPNRDEEFEAWREITGLSRRYGIAAGIVILVVDVLPVFFVALFQSESISSPFQPNSLNSPNPIYVLVGGTVSLLGSVIFALLIIDRFTLPARLILVPGDFETQLKGRFGALFVGKFQILILALIAIGVLLIAPLGYQQTVRILYSEISSFEIFSSLRVQIILFSVMALVLGAGFSYYVSRSVSDPLNELIGTFNKIEQGDLSKRVPVSATDELGVVMVQFNRMVSRLEALQTTLEQQVDERTKQLTAINEVGRVASSSLDPDELLNRVVKLFPEQFGYYYAAIYLLDPGEKWAEIKAATGAEGKALIQNRYRIEVSGKSMVGSAIRGKMPRIAQIALEEKQRLHNPLLPQTRSEIALPLLAGDRVLGALNVQSMKEADFGPQVVATMQSMAGQVAIALENARLFQEAQQVIRELRVAQQQYLLDGWSRFSEHTDLLEYGVGDEAPEGSRKMDVPISLRDQTLGQITLEGREEWTSDQQSLVEAVASQVAIALENARLANESRQVAMREHMLAEIHSKIWASTTIDGVLQTVVKELGRRLDASQVTIELDIEPEE